jgi:hypothetical protein
MCTHAGIYIYVYIYDIYMRVIFRVIVFRVISARVRYFASQVARVCKGISGRHVAGLTHKAALWGFI